MTEPLPPAPRTLDEKRAFVKAQLEKMTRTALAEADYQLSLEHNNRLYAEFLQARTKEADTIDETMIDLMIMQWQTRIEKKVVDKRLHEAREDEIEHLVDWFWGPKPAEPEEVP